jgi:hypothetical protein
VVGGRHAVDGARGVGFAGTDEGGQALVDHLAALAVCDLAPVSGSTTENVTYGENGSKMQGSSSWRSCRSAAPPSTIVLP